MLDGYRKVDPETQKKLPVQSDIPELLVETAYASITPERQQAMADLTMIAFYYLLWVGEYMVKGAVGQSALPTLWGLGRTSTERRNGVGF